MRTRSQVRTRTTRPLVAEKSGLPTTRGRAKRSDSQKIRHTKGSLTVRVAQGEKGDGRTDTSSVPTSQKETQDLNQSAHYRLLVSGFLDVSLFLTEQEPATPTQAPIQAMATSGMNLDALAILQSDEIQKLIKSLQGLATLSQEGTTPTRQPPVHTSKIVEEDKNRWEQVGAG